MKKLVSLTRAFTFGMAALSIPALALAKPTFVELGNRGEIIGEGTAAAIPVTVACTDDDTPTKEYREYLDSLKRSIRLTVSVRGPVGEGSGRGEDAHGYDQQNVPSCDSRRQTVEVVVTPGRDQRFRRGRSYNANAHLYGCGLKYADQYSWPRVMEKDCGSVEDTETILLGNFAPPVQ